LWLAIWWAVYSTPKDVQREVSVHPISAWPLFRMRFVWRFTVSKVSSDPARCFYISWFP